MSEEILEEGDDMTTKAGSRAFLQKSGYTLAAVGGGALLASCGSDGGDEAAAGGDTGDAGEDGVEAVELDAQDGETVEWDMTTSWPAGLSTLQGAEDNNSGALGFARNVGTLTGGAFTINTFAAGDRAGALDVIDVIQAGALQAGHTASYFYRGLGEPWAFGTAIPVSYTHLTLPTKA